MASNDLTQKTARERAHWNGHASTYTDIYIIKDQHDATSQAVIAAVNKQSLAKGMLITIGDPEQCQLTPIPGKHVLDIPGPLDMAA